MIGTGGWVGEAQLSQILPLSIPPSILSVVLLIILLSQDKSALRKFKPNTFLILRGWKVLLHSRSVNIKSKAVAVI